MRGTGEAKASFMMSGEAWGGGWESWGKAGKAGGGGLHIHA